MKKLLIALAIVVALFGIAAVGVGYYVYRQARSMVASFAEFGQVDAIERGIRVRDAFVPPASAELTAAQVDRFMRVQSQVRARLGERFAEFERRYKSLSDKDNATIADVPALMAAYRDLAATWVEGKRAQVDGLNEVGLSLEEYRWIRDRAYQAAGMPFVDLDVDKIIEAVQKGSNVEPGHLRGAIEPGGPELNRKLVEAHKKALEQNLALASFGL